MLLQRKAALIFTATLILTLFLYNYDDISMVGFSVVMKTNKNKRAPIYLFTGKLLKYFGSFKYMF